MRAIDLFCGAGGMTSGLCRSGWNVVAGIDIDRDVGQTYERNNVGAVFVHADLRLLSGEGL